MVDEFLAERRAASSRIPKVTFGKMSRGEERQVEVYIDGRSTALYLYFDPEYQEEWSGNAAFADIFGTEPYGWPLKDAKNHVLWLVKEFVKDHGADELHRKMEEFQYV